MSGRPVLHREFSDDRTAHQCCRKPRFRYYWEALRSAFRHGSREYPRRRPHRGPWRERVGIATLVVGVDRGFITRTTRSGASSSASWTRAALSTWSPFMERKHGGSMPWFGMFDTVETGGKRVPDAKGSSPPGIHGRPGRAGSLRRVTQLWESVEWDWYRGRHQRPLFTGMVSTRARQIHHPLMDSTKS